MGSLYLCSTSQAALPPSGLWGVLMSNLLLSSMDPLAIKAVVLRQAGSLGLLQRRCGKSRKARCTEQGISVCSQESVLLNIAALRGKRVPSSWK